jgi:predicted DNA-binding transcriptional regulator AlpA
VPCIDKTGVKNVRWQYDSRDVDAYQTRYINTDQVAALSGYAPLTIQRWAASGVLPAVTGPGLDGSHFYRFDKAAIIAWRAERVTGLEAREILGMSGPAFYRRVKTGEIRQLSAKEKKGITWYSKQDVLRLREAREQKAQRRRQP